MSYIGQPIPSKSSLIRRYNITGSTSATHTLTWEPPNEQSIFVTINGIKQHEDAYSVSSYTLTLTSALVASDKLEVIGIIDVGVSYVLPADDTVTAFMLQTDSVTTAKIADDAVTSAKILDGTIARADLSFDPEDDATALAIALG
jgi:hypothetical protein